jgi:AcrR family transcriptional regulator
MAKRTALTRDRIVLAAVRVADRRGLSGVSMRTVGRELGVEAMSLYHHIAGKDDLVDELADWIFTRIALPSPDQPWRAAMIDKATSARTALTRHPWALGLIESRRNPGPALLRHHDAVLGCLERNGFPVALAIHAFSVVDAYVFGFVLSELNLPMEQGESAEEFVKEIGLPTHIYPHLSKMLAEQVIGQNSSYADEFDYGLQLILDALDERLGRPDGLRRG